MNAERFDVAVVGGGLVGLATARRMLLDRPSLRIVVLEKEATLAGEQSGHNSGVLHAGIYYQPGSLKSSLCTSGKAELEAYADERGIPFRRTGKLIVAVDDDEAIRLRALFARARQGKVPAELIGPERIREIEPNVTGVAALWSPTTGIIDFPAVARAMAGEIASLGGELRTGSGVTKLERRSRDIQLHTAAGHVLARQVVACAGLYADRVAKLSGDDDGLRIVPFRGDYYTLRDDAAKLIRGLVYPVPDPRFPFLGVHLTRRVDGQVWAGPNAVLAFHRQGYQRSRVSLPDLASAIGHRGFQRMAMRYWRTGLKEMWRDVSKRAFLAEVRRYLPMLESTQMTFGPSGVRAQAVMPSGELVDDFRFSDAPGILHVLNAPSPAATASLAIGRHVAKRVLAALDDLR